MKRLTAYLVLALGLMGLGARAQEADTAARAAAVAEPAAESAAVEPSDLWDRAHTAYINGDYRTAAERYEQLLARGRSAKLYYNLGNAWFKEGRVGRAILFYRRALRLDPGNDDIRYNLSIAQAQTQDDIEAIPAWFLAQWVRDLRHTMGCTAWSLLSLGALACAAALLLVYLLARRLALRKAGFYGTAAALLLFALTTGMAAGQRRELLDRSQAVVLASSVAVKSSPDAAATDLFILHEGTSVRIADRLGDWCEVSIADGKKGWLEARTIESV